MLDQLLLGLSLAGEGGASPGGGLFSVAGAISLVTLASLEIVLGIDNIIFIAILSGRLPREQQPKARQLGIAAAVVTRVLLLLSLSWVMGLTHPLVTFAGAAVSGKQLILIAGGLFLIGKRQGIDISYEGTPLGGGTSAGVHESQSRLWENIVGRSHGFWEYMYPKLQAHFPEQLKVVSLDTYYAAINKVEKSLIRTDADEVTYNLHVMLRFDFEVQLLEGTLSIRDLPEAWHERFEHDFGIVPPNDSDGVLQDVHWYAGIIGGSFQGYTLGNILSAQFYSAALKAHPSIPDEMTKGQFANLHGWLRENIYRHGSKYKGRSIGSPWTSSWPARGSSEF